MNGIRIIFWALCTGFGMIASALQAQDLADAKGDFRALLRSGNEPVAIQAQLERWNAQNVFSGSHENGVWKELGPVIPPAPQRDTTSTYRRIRGIGRIFSVEFSSRMPDRVWVTSPTGGLFISDNRGENWRNGGTDFLPNPGGSHALPHPSDPNTWYLATGDADDGFSFSYGIFRTTDAGATWKSIVGKPGNQLDITNLNRSWAPVYYRKMAFHPEQPNTLFAAGTTGIYRTDNAKGSADEVSWNRVLDGVFYDIAPVPGTRGNEWIAGGEQVFWSKDGGRTWSLLPGLVESVYSKVSGARKRTTIRISPENPNLVYFALTADQGEGSTQFDAHLLVFDRSMSRLIYLAELQREVGAQRRMGAGRAQAMAVNPQNSMEILLGNVTYVYQSVDGGVTFDRLEKDFHDDIHWITYHPTRPEIWLGTDGGVSMSTDGGATWISLDVGLGVLNAFNMAYGPNRGGIGYGGYDVGCNWQDVSDVFRLEAFGDGFEMAVDDRVDTAVYVYSSVNGGVFRRRNNERPISITPSRSLTGNVWKRHFALDPVDASQLFMAGRNVLQSMDRGENWRDMGPVDGTVWEVFTSLVHPDVVYASTVKPFGIYRCLNTRAENPVWEFFDAPYWVEDLCINPTDPSQFARVFGRYEQSDARGDIAKVEYWNGSHWEDWTGLSSGDNGLMGFKVYEVALMGEQGQRMYIGTNAGVYTKASASDLWRLLPGLPHVAVHDLEVDPWEGRLYAATYGRGIWQTDLLPDPSVTWIHSDTEWDLPSSIFGKVVIKSGKILRISSDIWVGERTRIVVQPGAELILDGAAIRFPERISWNGIQRVSANRRKPEGSLKFINGGYIQE